MTEQFPELAAILRTGRRSRFRLAELVCEAGGDRFAEVFRSPAGPILLGRGLLPTAAGDRQRKQWVIRYLDREAFGAAVSLQCRCSNRPVPVGWLAAQRGRIELPLPPRARRGG